MALALKIAAGGNISTNKHTMISSLIRTTVISKEVTGIFQQPMALGRVSYAEETRVATECISLVGWTLMEICSYTWIRRIRKAALAGSFSTFLWTAFLVTFITQSSLGLGHKAEGRADSNPHTPAWKFDLRSVGFTGFAPKQEQWGLNLRLNPICFISNDVVIATFITRDDVTTLARRDQPGELLPLRLHGSF